MFQLKYFYLYISLCQFFCFFLSLNLTAQERPAGQTTQNDTNKVYIYDTVRHEKVIYEYDTTWLNKNIKEHQIIDTKRLDMIQTVLSLKDTLKPVKPNYTIINNREHNRFELNLYSGFYYHLSSSYTSIAKYSDHVDLLNSSTNNLHSVGAGLKIQYTQNLLNLDFGTELFKISEKINFPENNDVIYDEYYDINITGQWQPDTIESYYQYINEDTTWVYLTRDKWVEQVDSSLIIKADTVLSRNARSGKNNYLYINLPINIGTNIFKKGLWECSLHFGITPGVLIYTHGYTISTDNINQYTKIKNSFHSRFMLMMQAGSSIKYNLTSGVGVYLAPVYRQNVFPSLSNNTIWINHSYFGIHGGINILFN